MRASKIYPNHIIKPNVKVETVEETLPKKEEISTKPKKKKTLLDLIEEEENKIEE
jgi:hypothetical protein